jgi:formiminotetrahydrofolate cyclodeaminase
VLIAHAGFVILVRHMLKGKRYDRLQDALKPIKETLDEIKQSLQHKADK